MMRTLSLAALFGLFGNISVAIGQEANTPPIASAFDMKRCVNMGNSLERKRDGEWGTAIDITKFNDIKAAGFDTVRIPVRWSDYTASAPDYTIDSAFLAEVTTAVDTALANELNVIINVHHFDEIMVEPKEEMRRLLAIWRQVATHFADRSENLWFETLNEPHNELKDELMRATQRLSYLAIRETNPKRIVILGGEEWSGINSLSTNLAPPDNNIVYTVHYYDPFGFTHQYASWVPQELISEKRGWGSKEDREELKASVAKINSFRKTSKHPVFVGEFGAHDPIDNAERVKWVGAVRKAMEDSEIPWCLWSFSNTFALYNEETGWDTDMVSALGVNVPEKITVPEGK